MLWLLAETPSHSAVMVASQMVRVAVAAVVALRDREIALDLGRAIFDPLLDFAGAALDSLLGAGRIVLDALLDRIIRRLRRLLRIVIWICRFTRLRICTRRECCNKHCGG